MKKGRTFELTRVAMLAGLYAVLTVLPPFSGFSMSVKLYCYGQKAKRVCIHKFKLAMGRTTLASHPGASPT